MNSDTSIAVIAASISLSVSIGVSFYYYTISQIKDPVSMCFAKASGEKEMNVCLKLKEMSSN
jgi:hypothetical protein